MRYRIAFSLVLFMVSAFGVFAQKEFTEGTIIYNVKLTATDNRVFTGTYTFTFKGSQLRKDLKLNNGYQDVILVNSNTNSIYSLQNRNNRRYAIELNMTDILKQQEMYSGFSVTNEVPITGNTAGCNSLKGTVTYKDGTSSEVIYTKDWYPSQPITFGRFPDSRFIPLIFSYKDESGYTMQFDAEKIDPAPVESGIFRIPADYTIISNAEYKKIISGN